MNERGWGFLAELTTAPQLLARARRIGAIAAQHADDAPYLRSAAAFMTASALAQRIRQRIETLAQLEADEGDTIPDRTEVWLKLSGASFREQFRQLPLFVTEGEFELDRLSDSVRAIHELITIRNQIAHVDEPPILGDPSEIEADDVSGGMRITVQQPVSPWTQVEPSDLERYQRAVELYFDLLTHDGAAATAGRKLLKRTRNPR